MANYLEIIDRTEFTFKSQALNKEAEAFRKAAIRGQEVVMDMAKSLYNIKNKELWREDFNNFEECYSSFGVKKAQAYKLIQGYEIYSKYRLTDFNNSQCVELVKLEKEEGSKGIEEALKSGLVAHTMTAKEIREAVDNHLHPEKSLANETETETETETTEKGENDDFNKIICQVSVENGQVKVDTVGDFKLKAVDVEKIKMLFQKYLTK